MQSITRFILVFFTVLFLSNQVWAQEFYDSHLRLEEWNKGEITLMSGKKIEGDICFNYFLNLVQYLDGDQITTYGKTQVSSFRILESDEEQELNYKLLKLPTGHDFYRILAEDEEKAFVVQTFVQTRKEYYAYPSINLKQSIPDASRTASVQSHFERTEIYILIRKTGQVEPFARIALGKKLKGRVQYNSKDNLKTLLSEFDQDIEDYIQQNSLNIKKRNDLIQIIQHIMGQE